MMKRPDHSFWRKNSVAVISFKKIFLQALTPSLMGRRGNQVKRRNPPNPVKEVALPTPVNSTKNSRPSWQSYGVRILAREKRRKSPS